MDGTGNSLTSSLIIFETSLRSPQSSPEMLVNILVNMMATWWQTCWLTLSLAFRSLTCWLLAFFGIRLNRASPFRAISSEGHLQGDLMMSSKVRPIVEPIVKPIVERCCSSIDQAANLLANAHLQARAVRAVLYQQCTAWNWWRLGLLTGETEDSLLPFAC